MNKINIFQRINKIKKILDAINGKIYSISYKPIFTFENKDNFPLEFQIFMECIGEISIGSRPIPGDGYNVLRIEKPKNLVAVTGTNGKSSITNFFHQILSLNNKPVSSIGTLGININKKEFQTKNTTLDSLLLNKYLQHIKKNKIDNVILEASSHGLKQNRLDYIKFDIGIFTNLSRDHLDYHRSFKDYLNSKLILFKKLMKKKSKVIFNDNIKESNLLKKICKKNNIKTVTLGKMNSDINIINHFYESDKQIVNFFYKKKFYKFETKLIGKIQVYNLLMAMLAAHQSKVSIKKILNILKKIKPVNGRMEQIGIVKNNAKIILDYAHTPDALQICLINIKEQFKNRKINIVFGCG